MGNSNNKRGSINDENMAPENISASREVGCFCIGNGNVDLSNEMYISNDLLPIS